MFHFIRPSYIYKNIHQWVVDIMNINCTSEIHVSSKRAEGCRIATSSGVVGQLSLIGVVIVDAARQQGPAVIDVALL